MSSVGGGMGGMGGGAMGGGTSAGAAWNYLAPGNRVSGRAGKGGIWGSSTVDMGPPCCQICTEKFYHQLAFLELPARDEAAALSRFRAFRSDHQRRRRARRPNNNGDEHTHHHRPVADRMLLLETRAADGAARRVGADASVTHSKGFLGGSMGGGMMGGNAMLGGGPTNGGQESTENMYGGLDVLERMQYLSDEAKQRGPPRLSSSPPVPPNPDRMSGQMGGGKCCNICPLWFIPTNQKLHQQRDIQPEYGPARGGSMTALVEEAGGRAARNKGAAKATAGNAEHHTAAASDDRAVSTLRGNAAASASRRTRDRGFVSSMASMAGSAVGAMAGGTIATSRGAVGEHASQCCNVCTDEYFPPGRDINAVNDATLFMEVKARLRDGTGMSSRAWESATSKATSGFGPPPATATGGCCYMCSEKASGGWDGTEPFSEPTSWDQHIQQQTEDPELMTDIARRRAWNHRSTAANHFLLAMQALESAANAIGGLRL